MSQTSVATGELAGAGPGQLRKYEGYRSRFLSGERTLIVYRPGIYDQNPQLRCPVLYMQDGQNLFDGATSFIPGMYWRVGETADKLIGEGAIRPLVIVGIYNTGKRRLREYTPSRDKKLGGGGADRYGRMLRKEIMPFIDSEYRTLTGPANTGLGGSSLGGLLTLYLGLKLPKVFGKLAVLSPSLWWNQGWILKFAERARATTRPRIWLDSGTNEGGHTVEFVHRMRDLLSERGWRYGENLQYDEIPGGQHNEGAWAQRVDPFLRYLFPAGETAV